MTPFADYQFFFLGKDKNYKKMGKRKADNLQEVSCALFTSKVKPVSLNLVN